MGKPVPSATTFGQTVTFLEWVWQTEPPAEQVRSVLPAAYEYVEQDIHADSQTGEYWRAAIASAKVYTSRKQWRPVASVYYDDLRKPGLLKLLSGLEFATRGHLGADPITVEKEQRYSA